MDPLLFEPGCGTVKERVLAGSRLVYRAFEGIVYCAKPVDQIQKLNLFVPEVYYHGESIRGYALKTAPIFVPNSVGGYMPGAMEEPGMNDRLGEPNAIFQALHHGYVVVSPGIRGRSLGPCGKAPALAVDMKAVVRYLRHNRESVPGDVERIITSGTSAGGALSAMTGSSGNSPDFEPYLEAIGAAQERDDIFAANCYCPIHNLEHADMAYEWLFSGESDYYWRNTTPAGTLTKKQQALSRELKAAFSAYLNSLNLTDTQKRKLTLDEDGNGSFRDYVEKLLLESANEELHTYGASGRLKKLAIPGSDAGTQSYLTYRNGRAVKLDWARYAKAVTRMKPVPAFDALDLSSPENDEFGTQGNPAQFFTPFAIAHSKVAGTLAEEKLIRMLNPLYYIGSADTAPYWRIRYGAYDRDTALAIPVILALTLQNKGFSTDFRLPWGLPHSGDYDLEELFSWIDRICEKTEN